MLKNCLILSVREFKENSLIVSVFQAHLGRQEFLAKGAKRPGAKLTPWLTPLYLVNLWLAPTRAQRPIIKEVEMVECFLPSRPLSLRLALKMVVFLEKAMQPSLEASGLMRHMQALLRRIKKPSLSIEELTKFWIQFELLLLSFLGVSGHLEVLKNKSIQEVARTLERRLIHFLSL